MVSTSWIPRGSVLPEDVTITVVTVCGQPPSSSSRNILEELTASVRVPLTDWSGVARFILSSYVTS